MVLEFIPPLWAGILLLIAILGLVFRSNIALMIAKINPLFPAKQTLLVLGVIGILAGGIGWITGIAGGLASGATASLTGQEDVSGITTGAISCVYSASDVPNTTAITMAQGSSPNDVYVTIDNSSYFAGDGLLDVATDDRVNMTWTCDRAGDIYEDASATITATCDTFVSDLDTASANEYRAVGTSTIKSAVYPGQWTQNVYVGDGAYATTTSPKEKGYLTYAEGDKSLTLGVLFDLESTSITQQGIGSSYTKVCKISSDGQVISTIYISKVA